MFSRQTLQAMAALTSTSAGDSAGSLQSDGNGNGHGMAHGATSSSKVTTVGVNGMSESDSTTVVKTVLDKNPFLDQPIRKMFKKSHAAVSHSMKGGQPPVATKFTIMAPKEHPLPRGPLSNPRHRVLRQQEQQQPQQQQQQMPSGRQHQQEQGGRLILTRVLPLNIGVAKLNDGVSSKPLPAGTLVEDNQAPSAMPSAGQDCVRIQTRAQAQGSFQGPEPYPSTTPKMPPNQEYFEFIKKAGPASAFRLESGEGQADQGKEEPVQEEDVEKEQPSSQRHQQLHEQEQHQTRKESKPLAETKSTMKDLAFARKSIMQHASTSPQDILWRLQSNHPQTPPLSAKAAAGTTSAEDTPMDDIVMESAEASSQKESTRAPRLAMGPPPPPQVAAQEPQVSYPSMPSIFSKSVLDFSQTAATKKPAWTKPKTTLTAAGPSGTKYSGLASTRIVACKKSSQSHNRANGEPTPEAVSTPLPDHVHDQQQGTLESTEMDAQKEVITESSSEASAPAFDIRAALRMDSARTSFQLPSLLAPSLSSPPPLKSGHRGIGGRITPYKVPSTNEREALRVRRTMPRFRARPLDPKVFTSAGDLGVPRIPKQPLTVPVSPVFSQSRTRNALAATTRKEVKVESQALKRLQNQVRTGGRPSLSSGAGPIKSQVRRRAQEEEKSNSVVGAIMMTSPPRRNQNQLQQQQTSGMLVSPSWNSPLVVPSLDQMRKDLGASLGDQDGGSAREADQTLLLSHLGETGPSSDSHHPTLYATAPMPLPAAGLASKLGRSTKITSATANSRLSSMGPPQRVKNQESGGGSSRPNSISEEVEARVGSTPRIQTLAKQQHPQHPPQQQQQQQQQRKPATKPVPFRFATTELQRKRTLTE